MVVSFPSSLYYINVGLTRRSCFFYRSKAHIATLKNHYTKKEKRSFFYLKSTKKNHTYNFQRIK